MVKNTGIPENQLSDYDYPQVLQDSHNKPLHALDVNQVNSLVPSSYQSVSITRDANNCNRITQVDYFGLGKQEIQDVLISKNPQGKAEVTIYDFIGVTPASLDAKYALIYDDVGSVGILFRLDGGSTATSGADRDITVDIATGDNATALAQKTAAAIDADSKFIGVDAAGLCQLTSSTVGNKTNATSGDSGLATPLITDGYDSLAGKLFYVYKSDDSEKYAFYYTIDGSGSEPSHSGASITAIDISSSDGTGQVATKTAAVITLNSYLTSSATDSVFRITWRANGDTTGFEDSDAGFTSTTVQAGEDVQNVATILLEYDACGNVIGVERV
jgi:hypothetical protein